MRTARAAARRVKMRPWYPLDVWHAVRSVHGPRGATVNGVYGLLLSRGRQSVGSCRPPRYGADSDGFCFVHGSRQLWVRVGTFLVLSPMIVLTSGFS